MEPGHCPPGERRKNGNAAEGLTLTHNRTEVELCAPNDDNADLVAEDAEQDVDAAKVDVEEEMRANGGKPVGHHIVAPRALGAQEEKDKWLREWKWKRRLPGASLHSMPQLPQSSSGQVATTPRHADSDGIRLHHHVQQRAWVRRANCMRIAGC